MLVSLTYMRYHPGGLDNRMGFYGQAQYADADTATISSRMRLPGL